MDYHLVFSKSNTTGATSGTGTAYEEQQVEYKMLVAIQHVCLINK
jgi:hypothetical protein